MSTKIDIYVYMKHWDMHNVVTQYHCTYIYTWATSQLVCNVWHTTKMWYIFIITADIAIMANDLYFR